MNKHYSYLKDELALAEIRRHKWLESEKLGHEIGFATAALDWIQRHGPQWLNHQLNLKLSANIFQEKRQYRRFNYQIPIQLKVGPDIIASYSQNVNLIGLSCVVPHYINENETADITLQLPLQETLNQFKSFTFKTQIQRISATKRVKSSLCYDIFVPFSEEARGYLRNYFTLSVAVH